MGFNLAKLPHKVSLKKSQRLQFLNIGSIVQMRWYNGIEKKEKKSNEHKGCLYILHSIGQKKKSAMQKNNITNKIEVINT